MVSNVNLHLYTKVVDVDNFAQFDYTLKVGAVQAPTPAFESTWFLKSSTYNEEKLALST